MRIYLLLPLALLFSCRTVKNSNASAQNAPQLLQDVKELSSDKYQGRKTGTKGAELAKEYIKKRFKEIGLQPFPGLAHFEQEFRFQDDQNVSLTGKNVVGFIKGKTDDVIVISAHYDHLGVINNEVFNGADDNASGIAGLLKIATFYAKTKPNNTFVFVGFDAGEENWKGSEAFLVKPPVPLANIKLNINLDMISHNDKGQLFASGTHQRPELKDFIVYTNPNLRILFGHDNPKQKVDDWTFQSDQGAFENAGIPWIYFGVEDHKDYHKASDKFENINQSFFIDAANAILEIVDNIDRKRDLKTIIREKQIMNRR